MGLEELKQKKVLILGFAREGKDTFLFLKKRFPKKRIGIADQKLNKNYLREIKKYDIIVKSPGIPNWKITPFCKKEQIITSQTDIFFENCPGTIIGVTGTKGKSTTASLIYHVLKNGGLQAHLVGNIGEPVLSYLAKAKPEDVFVYELSSFQLENLKEGPHIAVFLNIYPEHLDHHRTFENYVRAKSNIIKWQTETDFLIYNARDPIVSKIVGQAKAQKIPFSPEKNSKNFIASRKPAKLVGKLFGISEAKIKSALKKFKSLPHRLEKVGKYKGIMFYNDSLATIPEATIAAITALGPEVHTLVAGGFDRGISYKKLGQTIQKSNIKTLILFPTTGQKILSNIQKPPKTFFAHSMKEAVRLCYMHTPKGTVCLMSPASSSFNMFKHYQDRGNQFKKFVKLYGKKK